jgi:hypothetical protein
VFEGFEDVLEECKEVFEVCKEVLESLWEMSEGLSEVFEGFEEGTKTDVGNVEGWDWVVWTSGEEFDNSRRPHAYPG